MSIRITFSTDTSLKLAAQPLGRIHYLNQIWISICLTSRSSIQQFELTDKGSFKLVFRRILQVKIGTNVARAPLLGMA